MRIALCLSGQARSLTRGYEYIKRNLLDCHHVDVFCHTWSGCDVSSIDKLYSPVSILCEKCDIFPEPKYNCHARNSSKHPVKNTLAMYYSIMASSKLKIVYEELNCFKYDFVIRCRYDFALSRRIDFQSISSDTIWTPTVKIPMPNGFICTDQFAFSSSNLMDYYSNAFLSIEDYAKEGVLINGEDILSRHLRDKRVGYIDMYDPFFGGKYNMGPHSLIRDDMDAWV